MTAIDFLAIRAEHASRLARDFGDRSQTVGASEIGQCERKTWFVKNAWDVENVVRDEDYHDGWGARMRGTVYENHFWEPALRAHFNGCLRLAGTEQRTLARDYLSATSDALITGLDRDALASYCVPDIEGDCVVVDCKTADPRTNLNEAKAENVYQVHVQIGLIRELTPFRPSYGVLDYTDASFWDEAKIFPIRFDPAIYAEAQARSTRIMTARNAASLRPEGVITGGQECKYCPYTRSCGTMRANFVPVGDKADDIDPVLANKILDLARLTKAYDAIAEEHEQKSRDLKALLKEALHQAGTRKFAREDISISWVSLKGRPSTDMAAFKLAAMEAGVDIADFETTGDPSDRLVVNEKKAKGKTS